MSKSNIQTLQEFFINIFNKIAYPLTFILLILSLYNIHQTKKVQDTLYLTIMYDIFKQDEKFKKDENDIKNSDLSKFMHFCIKKDESFLDFVKKENGDNSFNVEHVCDNIIAKYKERKQSLL